MNVEQDSCQYAHDHVSTDRTDAYPTVLLVGTSNNQGITTTTLRHTAEVDKDIKYTMK